MSNAQKSRTRMNVLLNSFAILVTIIPIVTLSWTLVNALRPDTRQLQQLAPIARAQEVELFNEPIVTVTFDDGWESIYSHAAPIMSEYQIASTQYILPSQFSERAYISVDQAKSLRAAGHEITSHTYTHPDLTKLSDKRIREELDVSVQVLRQFDLADEGSLNFAAPVGAVDDRVLAHIKPRFGSSRNVMGDLSKDISGNDMNMPGQLDRYNIIGYTVGQYTTDEQFRGALAYAKAHNAWFVPIYHQVDYSGDKYSVTPETFRRQMQLIKSSGIQTATMRDVIQAMEQ